jgi:hypothetical protein
MKAEGLTGAEVGGGGCKGRQRVAAFSARSKMNPSLVVRLARGRDM